MLVQLILRKSSYVEDWDVIINSSTVRFPKGKNENKRRESASTSVSAEPLYHFKAPSEPEIIDPLD